MIMGKCLHCNIEFTKRRLTTKFCSRECKGYYFAWKKNNFKGVENNSFKRSKNIIDDINYYYENECKIPKWNNGKTYTRITINKKRTPLHRYIWELKNGLIPEKMVICHKCDNPKCCNIKHLFIGTQKENIKDMYNKKRNNNVNREKHGRSILNSKQVLKIRELFKNGEKKSKIATIFNVSRGCIYHIYKNNSWKDLTEG